jgi:hypothetical protein
MQKHRPDIVVVSPDGEYLVVIEVKPDEGRSSQQEVVHQVKSWMASMGCSVGLAIVGEHIFLLRDSLEKPRGESIALVGEAKLPDDLLPLADESWRGEHSFEFAARVQRWLEELKFPSSAHAFPADVENLLGESIINLFRIGEIRAAMPRWSRVAS